MVRALAGGDGEQGRLGVDLGETGVGGVAHVLVLVVEEAAEALDDARVVEVGEGAANLDAVGLAGGAAELQEQAEGAGVTEEGEGAGAAEGGVLGARGHGLDERGEVVGREIELGRLELGRGFGLLLGVELFDFPQLPMELAVARAHRRSKLVGGEQRHVKRGVAHLGVAVVAGPAQGGADPNVAQQFALVHADDGLLAHVGVLAAEGDEIGFRGCFVVDRLEGRDGGEAGLLQLAVDGLAQQGHGLVVVRGQFGEGGDGGGADGGVVEGEFERAQVVGTELAAQSGEGGGANRLVVVPKAGFEQLGGRGSGRRRR